MPAFPLMKLGYLAVRQISKPIANSIKRRAKTHPIFRKYICMPPAQLYHWFEVKIQLKLMGLGKTKSVPKMSDAEAIELGGEMLGEFIIFGTASLVLIADYARSSIKEAAKEEAIQKEKETVNKKLEELFSITEIQEAQIRDLQKSIDKLMEEKKKSSVPVSSKKGILG